jgi:hypothetical protein
MNNAIIFSIYVNLRVVELGNFSLFYVQTTMSRQTCTSIKSPKKATKCFEAEKGTEWDEINSED